MAKKPEHDEDLREAMREERRRGARSSLVSQQKDRELKKALSKALAALTEREFVYLLREEFGITEASPQFSRMLEIWREQH